jgi:hypothetical protein
MADTGMTGEVLAVACPVEEIVWGKLVLLKAGAFEGFDARLGSHGDYQNGAMSRLCQSVLSGEFVFLGESGRGGGVRRQNALDAAELAVQSIERLHAHHFPDASVEQVLRVAGNMPSGTLAWPWVEAWLGEVVDQCGTNLLRLKAILAIEGEAAPVVFYAVQHVIHRPERLPAWPDGVARGQIVIMGPGPDPARVDRLLADLLDGNRGQP